MKTTKSILFLAAFIFSVTCVAQVTVYTSYENFKKDEGIKYEDFQGSHHVGSKQIYTFINGGKKIKESARDMWGFKYKDKLFRIIPESGFIVMLISEGKIVYYENGFAHIQMLKYGSSEGIASGGFFCYISEQLDSEIVPVADYSMSPARKPMKKFATENPFIKPLFDCVAGVSSYEVIRRCVIEFEAQ